MSLPALAFHSEPHTVVLGSGKARSGCSTAAALLAVSAWRAGRSVLAVEADGTEALAGLLGIGAPEGPDVTVEVAPGLLYATARGGSPLRAAEVAERGAPRTDLVVVDAGTASGSLLEAHSVPGATPMCVTGSDQPSLASSYALCKLALGRSRWTAPALLVVGTTLQRALGAHGVIDTAARTFLAAPIPFAGVLPFEDELRTAPTGGLLGLRGSLALEAASRVSREIDSLRPRVGPRASVHPS